MSIFTNEPQVITVCASVLRSLSYSYFIYGWWNVTTQVFHGAGDTSSPTYINFVFFWLLQMPLVYYLAIEMEWEDSGVFWAVFFSETSAGLFTMWLFTRGKWKRFKV